MRCPNGHAVRYVCEADGRRVMTVKQSLRFEPEIPIDCDVCGLEVYAGLNDQDAQSVHSDIRDEALSEKVSKGEGKNR